ncbi:nuclear factor NF-kappa-B p110 subunit [Caerostris extrusa]|uniref:Nuclear factor NF-kappa-B p110 subunit n=1 Tax=Caerostris extrusa TaxID=172846 RepID=A0AAV4SDR4_CAEEX|nr:nuclear factor NF-kappa-B p110 subunit [Caerostris extrusa]
MPARNKGRAAKNSECTYTTLANAIPQTGFYQSVCGMEALLSNGSMSNDHSFGNNNLCLKIVEQPISVFRYRYKSEKGSHGIIKGESNMRSKKCFPSVKLENISPGCKRKIIIRASLYSSDENDPKPHVYELTGKNCSNGTCDVELDKNSMAVFSTLGITTRKREEVLEILKDRKISEYGPEYDLDLIANEVQEEVKNMNFDSAKLCFEAFFADDLNSPLCEKVFSNPINHQRSTASGDLKIHRVSLCTGKCSGGDEVFLLCEKVKKR